MATVISILFQWIGVVFLVGSIILIVRDNKKSMPNEAEKDYLIACGAIAPDCKDKKILRKATRELRNVNYVLKSFELTDEEIYRLQKQARTRKALKQSTQFIEVDDIEEKKK